MGRALFRFVLAFAVLPVLAACNDDDLKNVGAISSKQVVLSKDRTLGAELIYSDSARVKAKGYAPVLDKVTPKTGANYMEMPDGLKIDFFDQKMKIASTVTSEYGIRRENERITILRRNVVVKNAEGNTFTSEELIWDENKRLFYSNQRVKVFKPDGSFQAEGSYFEAPQDFSTYTMRSGGIGQGSISGELLEKETGL
ncbi:LPS export ABC transporter periplasmic protein LptC [Pedobacter yulinensis]|uniref:LPS export ABC transporter periplasmic protein LptC n=1 Tax=Pedobacter yulinensis TaxID=2126353 RepID=A0A2T3HNR6_9SPHI|nr:LPS export ABC transporter periplasmic protein LptC [Pedobacter yulinensis]PST84043.1 LPS export ABC transporter periplasmic protein LptC [Pedobacter yulinensis]